MMVFGLATALRAIGLTVVQELVHSCSIDVDRARDQIGLTVSSIAFGEGLGASPLMTIARKHCI